MRRLSSALVSCQMTATGHIDPKAMAHVSGELAHTGERPTDRSQREPGACFGRDKPPRHTEPQPRPRFIQRPQRGLKTKPRISTRRTRTLGHIEPDAVQRPTHLRPQIPIPPSHRLHDRPSQPNDRKNLIQELLL
jgi:hypothetical protein